MMWQLAIPLLGQLLDKIIPDTGARDAAKLELLKAQQSGELQQIIRQLDINKEEAKSTSLFVSGWRPSVGWCCSAALAYQFLVRPISTGLGHEMPAIDTEALSTLLYALLGVAGLRSVEKIKGAA